MSVMPLLRRRLVCCIRGVRMCSSKGEGNNDKPTPVFSWMDRGDGLPPGDNTKQGKSDLAMSKTLHSPRGRMHGDTSPLGVSSDTDDNGVGGDFSNVGGSSMIGQVRNTLSFLKTPDQYAKVGAMSSLRGPSSRDSNRNSGGRTFTDSEVEAASLKNYLEDYCMKRGIKPDGMTLYDSLKARTDPVGNVVNSNDEPSEKMNAEAERVTKINDWVYGPLDPSRRTKWHELREKILDGGITESEMQDLTGTTDNNVETNDEQIQQSDDATADGEVSPADKHVGGSLPLPRERIVDCKGRAYGTGRRKTSVARVWISLGTDGSMIVNGESYITKFPRLQHRQHIFEPFLTTETYGKFNVRCTVKGGGVSGQAGAIRLGVARALQNFTPQLRPALKEEKMLTRDSRMVERKKFGRKKARKSFPFVKR